MTYEKIFSEVRKNFKKAKVTDFTESFAFQFNITGEGEGIFYTEFKNGVLSIEPYDYKDRDVIFESDGKTLIAISSGKMEPIDAIKSGKLSIDGNHELAKQLIFLMNTTKSAADKKSAPKAAAKKESKPSKAKTVPAAKSKTAAKSEVKTEAKQAPKTQKKTAAKAETKPAVKAGTKTEAKTEKK